MKLYHGSNQAVKIIDIAKGRRFKDFGQGFYATHLRKQAEEWSQRIVERYKGSPIVSEFEFDLEGALNSDLKIKIFEEANREWALFVMANRNETHEFHHDYDIVIGPVADDRMAKLFGLYEMEVIDLDAVVAGLIYKDLNSQYFFGTQKSLEFIKPL